MMSLRGQCRFAQYIVEHTAWQAAAWCLNGNPTCLCWEDGFRDAES